MNHPSPHGTILGRALWPALLAGARIVVAEHEGGKLCDHCIKRWQCGRLATAQTHLANPEMLRVEREATP